MAVIFIFDCVTLQTSHCNRQKTREMSSFPNLTNNPTITGKLLTPDMFAMLKDKCTAEGYDIDNLIGSRQHNLSENFTSELRTPRDCWWAMKNTVKTPLNLRFFAAYPSTRTIAENFCQLKFKSNNALYHCTNI